MTPSKNPVTHRKAKSRVFDSMGQAASSMGIAIDVLSAAKKAGCPAFKLAGRVNESEFQEWFKEHSDTLAPKVGGSLKEQKVAEEVRKLKLRNDRDEKILVPKSAIIEFFRKYSNAVRTLRRQRLENEFPAQVAGLEAAEIRSKGRELVDELDAIDRSFGKDLCKL